MPIRPILRYPDLLLRQPTRELEQTPAGDEVRALVTDMIETMFSVDGAGLAATQVGSDLRIFVIDARIAGGASADSALVFVNPRIVELSREKEAADEGCLSFPGVFVPIRRSLRARVQASDLEGRSFEVAGEGLFARALQHEIDHIDGRLIIDSVGPVKRELIKRRLRREAAAGAEAGGDETSPAPGAERET